MQHALEHAMNIVTGTRIELEHLPVNLKQSRNEPLTHLWESIEEKNLSRVMKKIECQIIHQVLKKYKGNVSRAADELGIPRQTLQYKLRTGETDFREESGEKKY
jgi:arginine utilization regulatory protein